MTLLRSCGVALSAVVGGCVSSRGSGSSTTTESPVTDEPTATDASPTTTAVTTPEVREVGAGGLEETVTVERSRFDCNESATDAVVSADGVNTGTVSQSMACGTTTA